MFLTDEEIETEARANPSLVKNLVVGPDAYAAESLIQPASLDLTIGAIYLPEADSGKPGSIGSPRKSYPLHPGQTAVVQTLEILTFPNDLAGIGFPPSSVSSRGILMTNPGHIDPGYSGTLEFTVINMGRESYELRVGDRIVTVLLFKLGRPCKQGWLSRRGGKAASGVTPEMLGALSKDFLDFDRRATKIAKGEESKTRLWGLLVPVVVGFVAFFGSVFQTKVATEKRIQALETEVALLEEKSSAQGLEDRVAKLEAGGTPAPSERR
jgi:deoxycytidine triphosphate deaminase